MVDSEKRGQARANRGKACPQAATVGYVFERGCWAQMNWNRSTKQILCYRVRSQQSQTPREWWLLASNYIIQHIS
jgi:hypothetical protein